MDPSIAAVLTKEPCHSLLIKRRLIGDGPAHFEGWREGRMDTMTYKNHGRAGMVRGEGIVALSAIVLCACSQSKSGN